MKIKKIYTNSAGALLLRLSILFIVFGISRLVFYIYNLKIIGSISSSEILGVLRGAYIYDAASIFYINIPFIFLSLLPFRNRVKRGYQKMLAVIYVVFNTFALLINMIDIIYFEFKQGRITGGDLHYIGEGNFDALGGFFVVEYWWAMLLLIFFSTMLYLFSFRLVNVETKYRLTNNKSVYYISQVVVLALFGAFTIFAIRGHSVSPARFPLAMYDAGQYVQPRLTTLIQSNPFCLIRTISKRPTFLVYMDNEEAEKLVPTKKQWVRDSLDSSEAPRPNIVFLILEGFGSPHIKSLSDAFPEDRESYTPFLDSLINNGLIFTNGYKSGLRSIDALPSVLASIPSFKENLMRFGESSARYHALPKILTELGYQTMFLHGGPRAAMGFVAFGNMAGIKNFISQEDYEKVYGNGDYDGHWGIFDHKFMPYALTHIDTLKQPFMATLFTLSSHHPFTMPKGLENKFSEGTEPIHKTIKYADWALSNFFEEASKQEWFNNTLFVLVADHGSGADSQKYMEMPYCNQIPILFYTPDGRMKRKIDTPVQQIDIMPTILRMLKYEKPYFAFGCDMLDTTMVRTPIVHYNNNEFYSVTDSLLYGFDEKVITRVYNYRNDYINKKEADVDVALEQRRIEAYLQQYFSALENRNFTIDK